MWDEPVVRMRPEDGVLTMRHGPIDLLVKAKGEAAEVNRAYRAAVEVFPKILPELAGELSLLRRPVTDIRPSGEIAMAMWRAAHPYSDEHFATPMIAVAGSVADYILEVMLGTSNLSKAFVNNGGDIALHLSEEEHFSVGICENIESGNISQTINLLARDGVGGIATSGWRGRSHSIGIADAVTVFARKAAEADVAATLIANAMLPSDRNGIEQQAANSLAPDSDLGNRLVTIDVGSLTPDQIEEAIENSRKCADDFFKKGRIIAAYGSLCGQSFVAGSEPNGIKDQSQSALGDLTQT